MARSQWGEERERDRSRGVEAKEEEEGRSGKKAKVRKWQEETRRRWGKLDTRCEAGGKLEVKVGSVET